MSSRTRQHLLIAIVSSAFVFGSFSYAQSSGRTTAKSLESETPGKRPCSIKIEDLNFLGAKFKGNAHCIDASGDMEAMIKCKLTYGPGTRAVNPNNPNYGMNDNGDPARNPAGYYYCVDSKPDNSKESLCGEAVGLTENSAVDIRVRKATDERSSYDKDCVCAAKKEGAQTDVMDMKLCTKKLRDEIVQQQPPDPPPAPTPPPQEPTPPGGTATNPQPNPFENLRPIVSRWVADAEDCQRKLDTAKSRCTEVSRDNMPTQAAGAMTRGLGDAYVAGNSAAGIQQDCFKASIAANGAATAINSMGGTCTGEVTACKGACNKRYEDFEREISSASGGKTDSQIRGSTGDFASYYADSSDKIRDVFSRGSRACSGLDKSKDTISSLLTDVGRSLQNSLRCVCQTSNSNGDCNTIPSIQDCSTFPQPAACGVYGNLQYCAVGSPGYDARTCTCMQNPSAPGCGGGSGAGGGPSLFGGNIAARNLANGGGATNFAAGGGGKGGGTFSFSGSSGGGEGSPTQLGANSAFGSKNGPDRMGTTAAGGGGPGGGAQGAPTDPAAAAAQAADKGSTFGNVKSFFTSLASGAPAGKKGGTAGKGSGNGDSTDPSDMGKFKPRGLANVNKNGISTKNTDIWVLINRCAKGETCKVNDRNDMWILTP